MRALILAAAAAASLAAGAAARPPVDAGPPAPIRLAAEPAPCPKNPLNGDRR